MSIILLIMMTPLILLGNGYVIFNTLDITQMIY